MTDPLGQSQVIPYLEGLSSKGFKYTLISFEKDANYKSRKEYISYILANSGIDWIPISYTKRPPVISTLWDLIKLNRTCKQILRNNNFNIIHCRSYITSIIGSSLSKTYGLKFIFDMRGFWADERVDGGLWNLKNPMYDLIFKYFKRKERKFLTAADAVVCLTTQAKEIINGWSLVPNVKRLQVIPCSADFNNFSLQTPDSKSKSRKFLSISPDTLVVSYLGSLGTWYLLKEMLQFFLLLKERYSNSVFLFITPEKKSYIMETALSAGLMKEDLRILFAERKEVPFLMSASDINIFFIKPAFSKKGSSPTKLGEVLAMGIPVICNNIGDVSEVVESTQGGVAIDDFTEQSFVKALNEIPRLFNIDHALIREKAFQYYDLNKAIDAYEKVYHLVLEEDGA
jgi:glycosyltransferase involved in cell wall biosynthesis